MITEDYVSFEVAKLLKEKGFVGLCTAYYDCFTTDNFHCGYEPTDFNSIDTKIRNIVAAPTLQMAMKWLREVHKLHVSVIPASLNWEHQDIQDGWGCEVTHLSDLSYDSDYEFFQKKYQTYESACEAAIRHCLENLI